MSSEPLFPDFQAIMRTTAEAAPGDVNETAAQLMADARSRLQKATSKQLSDELRNPTTQWPAVIAMTYSEAMARVVETCAI